MQGNQLSFDSLLEYNRYFIGKLFEEELREDKIIRIETAVNNGSSVYVVDYEDAIESVCADAHKDKSEKYMFPVGTTIFLLSQAESNQFPLKYWTTTVTQSNCKRYTKEGRSELASSFTLVPVSWEMEDFKNVFPKNDMPIAIIPASEVFNKVITAMKNMSPLVRDFLIDGSAASLTETQKDSGYDNPSLNQVQLNAVNSALTNRLTIIQGLPGTGKTSIITNLIKEFVKKGLWPIAVVSSSDLCIDNIALKLMDEMEGDMVKLCSKSNQWEYGQNSKLHSICYHNLILDRLPPQLKSIYETIQEGGVVPAGMYSSYKNMKSIMDRQVLMNKKVFLSTAVDIGVSMLIEKQFKVVIMEDSTQITEPLGLIPLGLQGVEKVVLVGDDVKCSTFSKDPSLSLSLFERLIKKNFKSHIFDTQYRMHPDISEFPSSYFYDGRLFDGITREDRTLPLIKYPVYFFDHDGLGADEERNEDHYDTSYMNEREAFYIERIVEILIEEKNIPRSEIGVITAYSAQRTFISKLLEVNDVVNPKRVEAIQENDKALGREDERVNSELASTCNVNGVQISTIDAYQGREKDVIVMSCVRSNPNGTLGFLTDLKRMSVAFTRARCSFIMVGDSRTLSEDPMWDKYINRLKQKNFYSERLAEY